MHEKNISKTQFFILFLLLDLLIFSIAHVTVLNGYHGADYYVGRTVVSPSSVKKTIDNITTEFQAEKSYIERINLYITDLPADHAGYLNVRLEHGDKLLYSGYKPLSTIKPNEWFFIRLGVSLSVGDQYRIVISSSATTSLPCIYLADDGVTPILTYTYKNDLRIVDKVLVVVYYLCFYIICALLVLKYQKIIAWMRDLLRDSNVCSWKIGPYAIVNTLFAFIFLYGAGLTITDNSLLCLFALCLLLSCLWVENNFLKVKNVLCAGVKNKVLYILLALYTSFSIVGSRCFIYPLSMNISFGGVICFIGLSVAVSPLIVFITYVLGYRRNELKKTQTVGNMPWSVYFACFGIIMLTSLTYMRAFNPAISSPDTLFCMEHAINSIRGVVNWHPPFYILWLKAIVSVCNSAYTVLLVQYIWFALVFLEGMRFLYRRGISSAFIIAVTIFIALHCGNMLQLTTIWKDIPYTISVFWTSILIAKFVLENQRHKWVIYIELIFALICTALMRQNGMVVFIVLIPVLLYSFRKNRRMWLACITSVVIVLTVLFPLYKYLDIQENKDGGKYVGLGQDIMAVYYNGGILNDQAMSIVNVLSNNNINEFRYNPYYATSSMALQISVTDFIGAYLDTFVKNPVLMMREIIVRQDGIWNLLPGQDGGLVLLNYIGTMDGTEWNTLVPTRENNFITERLYEYTSRSVSTPLLNMFQWRIGIWTLLSVIAFAICVLFKNNRQLWLLCSVPVGHILSLMLALGWSDYRYYWPLVLIDLFLILLTLTIRKNEKMVQK